MSFGTKSNKEKVSANSFEIYKGKFLKIQRKYSFLLFLSQGLIS